MICLPMFPAPAGTAVLARPDAALLLRGRPQARMFPFWWPDICWQVASALPRGRQGAVLGVATHSAVHDEIIQVVTVGCPMRLITAPAFALPASGAQTRTVFSS